MKKQITKRSIARKSPRRSANSWNVFVGKHYKKLKTKYPNHSFDSLMTKLSKLYKGERGRTSPSRRSMKRKSPLRKKRSKSPIRKKRISSKKGYKYNASWDRTNSIYK